MRFEYCVMSVEFVRKFVLMSFCSNDADVMDGGRMGDFCRRRDFLDFPEIQGILTKFRRKRVYICLTYPIFEDFGGF